MVFDISIITPTLNCENTIDKCIKSIRSQTNILVQHIVQDGGSSDGTIEILKANNIKFFQEIDNGIYDAMNKGAARATGRFVMFLNGDDYLASPDILSKIVSKLDILGGGEIFGYGDICYVNKFDHIISSSKLKLFKKTNINIGFIQIPHPAMICSLNIIKQYPFDKSLNISADYKFQLQCMIDQKVKFYFLNERISHFKLGGLSTSSQKNKLRGLIECIRVNLEMFNNFGLLRIISKVLIKRSYNLIR